MVAGRPQRGRRELRHTDFEDSDRDSRLHRQGFAHRHLARLGEGSVPRLIASLKRKGVADSLIQQALAETDQST
jgi:hypothetical protein